MRWWIKYIFDSPKNYGILILPVAKSSSCVEKRSRDSLGYRFSLRVYACLSAKSSINGPKQSHKPSLNSSSIFWRAEIAVSAASRPSLYRLSCKTHKNMMFKYSIAWLSEKCSIKNLHRKQVSGEHDGKFHAKSLHWWEVAAREYIFKEQSQFAWRDYTVCVSAICMFWGILFLVKVCTRNTQLLIWWTMLLSRMTHQDVCDRLHVCRTNYTPLVR